MVLPIGKDFSGGIWILGASLQSLSAAPLAEATQFFVGYFPWVLYRLTRFEIRLATGARTVRPRRS